METNIYALATRKKFRYDSPQGWLSTEDLWDLPLTSTKSTHANLDDIAISLNKQLKEADSSGSFVKKTQKTDTELKAKFDIVLHIIQTKQEEAEAARLAKETAAKKQRIMELIEHKQDEALAGKSEEELKVLLASM